MTETMRDFQRVRPLNYHDKIIKSYGKYEKKVFGFENLFNLPYFFFLCFVCFICIVCLLALLSGVV